VGDLAQLACDFDFIGSDLITVIKNAGFSKQGDQTKIDKESIEIAMKSLHAYRIKQAEEKNKAEEKKKQERMHG
jgi:hypothetical protein